MGTTGSGSKNESGIGEYLSGPVHITINIDFEGHDVVRSDGFPDDIDVTSISHDEQKQSHEDKTANLNHFFGSIYSVKGPDG